MWPLLKCIYPGNEKEEWSNSDEEESPNVQSNPIAPLVLDDLCLQSHDGYESGDLGDVSHAYVTEGPHKDSDSEHDEPIKENSNTTSITKERVEGCGQEVEGRDQDGQVKREKKQVCSVVDSDSGETKEITIFLPTAELVQDILREMWRYCHAYHISNSVG